METNSSDQASEAMLMPVFPSLPGVPAFWQVDFGVGTLGKLESECQPHARGLSSLQRERELD